MMQNYVQGRAIDTRRISTILIHLISVVLIFVLPEMLMSFDRPNRHELFHWWMYTKSALMVAVFYINYLWIIDRTLLKKHHWARFVICNLVLIIIGTVLMQLFNNIAHEFPTLHTHKPLRHIHSHNFISFSRIWRDCIMMVLTISLSLAVRLSHQWIDFERRKQELIASNRETELNSLRSQLNPHFLFNTLNNIYALIEISPKEAQQAVHDLSRLLRYLIYENPEKVELNRELEYAGKYIELMKLRMAERPIEFKIIDNTSSTTQIAPLVFMTLIENAFKHGNTADLSQSISIVIEADDNNITCTTINHIATSERLDGNAGVGLINLRRRLELIYGSAASLTTSNENDIFYAKLHIDLS